MYFISNMGIVLGRGDTHSECINASIDTKSGEYVYIEKIGNAMILKKLAVLQEMK